MWGWVALLLLVCAAIGFSQQPPTRYPSPVDLAISPDSKRLYVVCEGTDELVTIDLATDAISARTPVGRVPRGIALSSDAKQIYITNSWSDTVTQIDAATLHATRTLPTGFEPHGITVDPRHGTLYVANRISGDVSLINLETGADAKRLVAGHGASYTAMSPDQSSVYVTHIYPNLAAWRTPPDSEITRIDAQHQTVLSRTRLHNMAGVFHIAFSADGRLGIATGLRPKNLIPLAHVEHGWAFVDTIAVFGPDIGDVVQLPLDELEHYFSLPFGIAIAPDKSKAYLSASGADEVAIVDLQKLIAAAHSPRRATLANDLSASAAYVLARIPVGHNPKNIVLSPDGARLYVANRLDDTISVIDTAHAKVTATIALGGPTTAAQLRRGERLFCSSKFAFQGQFGCANCHLDSTFDGLQWDLEPDGFGVDIVDNRAIEDVEFTAPFKWNGGNPDLETECGPRTERFFYRSQSYSPEQLKDLVAYVQSIPLRPNRYRLPNDELTPAQERGKAIFDRTTRKDGTPIPQESQCAYCHQGKYYTIQLTFDVGSGKPTDRSPEIDTPHLTNVVYSAPYLHDGSARTLEEIWTVFNPKDTHGITNDLSKDELNDLIEYLKRL